MRYLKLSPVQGDYAICKLDQDAEFPEWAAYGEFFSITRTTHELSIICLFEQVPEQIHCQPGWRVLKIEGPFEFSEIGVLAAITGPLAEAQISLLTISTFDTDYIFLQEDKYLQALQILEAAGHSIIPDAE